MQGKNKENSIKPSRRLAATQKYVSPNQLVLLGFTTPFEQQLTKENRWVKLSAKLPWDSLVSLYNHQFLSKEGRPPINGRIIIGSIIIKHMLNLTDDETILQIQENMFMQYFLGFSSFSNEPVFDSSLFVDIRKRLNASLMDKISLLVLQHNQIIPTTAAQKEDDVTDDDLPKNDTETEVLSSATSTPIATTTSTIDLATDITTPIIATEATHKGKLLVDATVAPQAITFPTDVKLLNAAREKSEQLIDILYKKAQGYGDKPRTYREVARKEFLNIAKKKKTTHQEKYKAIDQQLRYVKRNLAAIVSLIDYCTNKGISKLLKPKQNDYLQTIQKVYEQQHHMHITNKHTIENRIVNLHQPHVRPIVRGKAGKKTEFGSKLHVSLVDGFTFIDKLSWDNFNEGQCLQQSIQCYKTKFGYYPKEVLADKIYTTRDNRKYLKDLGIILKGKPLGRPSKDEALHNHISPSERNPIEGKFGQAKVAYGLERVRAKLRNTSEAWISSIVLVLNLVKLMRLAPLYLYFFIANLFFNKKLVRV